MTLALRVGGTPTRPADVSPSPATQRYANNACDTTKITYEFFNELIQNFIEAQIAYNVPNLPNDPLALKKLLDAVRLGGYDIQLGVSGKLSFADNSDYITHDNVNNRYDFFSNGNVGSSTARFGKINLGDEDLSDYRENIIFTPTFFQGVTPVTDGFNASWVSVSACDARYTRIGNLVTVNISNISISVPISYAGVNVGVYPPITDLEQMSIRGLPFNATKDACGAIMSSPIDGSPTSGTAYIVAGTNSIRFSSMHLNHGFGVRGVTMTYMI